MEWSKIKTIILIILAGTNLLLLSFVLRQDLQKRIVQLQARQEAVAFLEKNGVTVEENIIPKEDTLQPQQVERDRESEPKLAQALLGGQVEERLLGGEVYRYHNQRGYIQFHADGTFQGEFVSGAFPLDGADPRSYSVEILKKLNFQGEILEVTGEEDGAAETTVLLRQIWNGSPLFDRQVTLTYRGGDLVSMSGGRRLMGTPQPDESRQTLEVPTALIRFYHGLTAMGDVCSRIDSITQGYVASNYSPGSTSLVPVWQVATDTGTYLLDMLTGEVSRVETAASQENGA